MTPSRVVAAAAVWLAGFAALFAAGRAFGAWPEPPEGFLAGSDLAAGLAFGAILLVSWLYGFARGESFRRAAAGPGEGIRG